MALRGDRWMDVGPSSPSPRPVTIASAIEPTPTMPRSLGISSRLLAVPALGPGDGVAPEVGHRLTSPVGALRNIRVRPPIAVRLRVADRLLPVCLEHGGSGEGVEVVVSVLRQRAIDGESAAVGEREAPPTLGADRTCLRRDDRALQAAGLETDTRLVEIHADDGDPAGSEDEDLGTAVRLAERGRPQAAGQCIGVLIQDLADRGTGVAPPADPHPLQYGVDLSLERTVGHRDAIVRWRRVRRVVEVIALVKHDCETCATLAPALEAAAAAGAPVRMVSQSSEADTRAFAQRVGLDAMPEVDDDLVLSECFDPDAVPAVVLLDGGVERNRVEGLHRARLEALFEAAGATLPRDGLPEIKPGCASITREPEVAARIAARRARGQGRIRARELRIGELEDVFEALHERGFTDGLPVVPPTPERVVAMLGHTGREAQEVVGVVPPYGGEATVEKVAINAVMAGCAGPELPIVLAAVHAACREEFALLGLTATTHPAGPTVIVSGPYAPD